MPTTFFWLKQLSDKNMRIDQSPEVQLSNIFRYFEKTDKPKDGGLAYDLSWGKSIWKDHDLVYQ